jgi:biotin synthase
MDRKAFIAIAEEIIEGRIPDDERYRELLATSDMDCFQMLYGSDLIRNFYFGTRVHLCAICNGKSGRCSEDCRFCSQSVFSKTGAPVYPLMNKDDLKEGGLQALKTPINRYSIVTTGKGLPRREIEAVAEAMADLDSDRIGKCASLGVIKEDDLEILREAGITRYHHNLETCKSYFPSICSTHTYDERVNTLAAARRAGLSICAGGIFGIGETGDHIFELALALRDLDVDAVPLNFLIPVEGTPFSRRNDLTPLRCLKIIAFFRYMLPAKEIIICGGREHNLKDLHPMVFYAGASGIMTGNYLTAEGRTLEKDLQMIEQLGFSPREKSEEPKS